MKNRDDDEDEEYSGRFSSDYREEDAEFDAQEDEEPRRGVLAFVIALGILVVVSTVIWNAYRSGVREGGRDAPPRITAEGPAKVAPIDPGGETIPGQDVAIYDELDGAQTADAVPPAAESPRAAGQVTAEAPPVAAPKPVAAAGGPVTKPPVPAPAAGGNLAIVRNGPFMAQIAALRSEEAANAEWAKAARLAPDLFAAAQKDIQRADLGAKGIFYRLRAGSFASRDAADAFCDQVQASGSGCIVAAR